MNIVTSAQSSKFLFTYDFQAPKALVFNAFASADALNEWWGPVECKNTALFLDFRPGGIFHFKMEMDGHVSYGRFLFATIQPYDLLEFSNAFADEHANPVKAPFDIQLPVDIFYSLRFHEKNGITTITMSGTAVNATAGELEGFNSINEDMKKGFGSTFNSLAFYLEKIKSL